MKFHQQPMAALIMTLAFASLISAPRALAQSKKMDLDDLSVKGEVHNDNRLSILARQQNKLKDYIHYRKEFRSELYQEAPKELPMKAKPAL
jgi:hypothetical protein